MEHLTKLFSLMQISRAMPQYGYAIRGIRQNDLSNLAEHHYLVSFIAWQLGLFLNKAGAKLNIERILSHAMTHDIGELLGGDISFPYARQNPEAREYSRKFEESNLSFLSDYFGPWKEEFLKISKENMLPESDEALVYKVADYLECEHYLHYMDKLDHKDLEEMLNKLDQVTNGFKDEIAKREIKKFLKLWGSQIVADKGNSVL